MNTSNPFPVVAPAVITPRRAASFYEDFNQFLQASADRHRAAWRIHNDPKADVGDLGNLLGFYDSLRRHGISRAIIQSALNNYWSRFPEYTGAPKKNK